MSWYIKKKPKIFPSVKKDITAAYMLQGFHDFKLPNNKFAIKDGSTAVLLMFMCIWSVYSPYSSGLMSYHYLAIHPTTTDALLPCKHPDSDAIKDVIKDKHIFSAQKSEITHSL